MDKPKVGQEIEAQEPRELKMEEKRKLEKLLIADIESATARQEAIMQAERQALYKRLVSKPAAEVKALYERSQVLKTQAEEIKSNLKTLGYHLAYGDLRAASHGVMPRQVTDFDEKASEMRRLLAALKRNYVIKLFADHADAQSLFGSLAKYLERLVG